MYFLLDRKRQAGRARHVHVCKAIVGEELGLEIRRHDGDLRARHGPVDGDSDRLGRFVADNGPWRGRLRAARDNGSSNGGSGVGDGGDGAAMRRAVEGRHGSGGHALGLGHGGGDGALGLERGRLRGGGGAVDGEDVARTVLAMVMARGLDA